MELVTAWERKTTEWSVAQGLRSMRNPWGGREGVGNRSTDGRKAKSSLWALVLVPGYLWPSLAQKGVGE